MTDASSPAKLKATIRERLAATREATLSLLANMTDEHLYEQPEPIMGIPAWDLGHIALFEHRWLVEAIQGNPLDRELALTFDPFEHPRSHRRELELPDRKTTRSLLSQVRHEALRCLDDADLATDERLLKDGFVHDMVIRHEDQHRENMLVTLQLFPGDGAQRGEEQAFTPSDPKPTPASKRSPEGMVEIPESTVTMGQDPNVGTYDNEWPAHEVHLDAFMIDKAPVTNDAFLTFIEDGGYEDPQHWSEEGWLIKDALNREHPKHWVHEDGSWFTRAFDTVKPLPLDQPVIHVSYHEAKAYASWANKRLPTEAEWETAANLDPSTGEKLRFPWGDDAWSPKRANLGQRAYEPAPVGAYPEGTSPVGCHQLIGDVWEWTSSTFTGYPGFEAFPYEAYSKPHFDRGYKVLRGGSWATEPSLGHVTFRNWHQPDHQHMFTGFRCARTIQP